MPNGNDWYDDFRESVSRVNQQYGIDEPAGVSLFFKVLAGLNPIKWFTSAWNIFTGKIFATPISSRGTWAIDQTRKLLSFLIPFAGITAALVSAVIEYNMLTELYDSTPMELSEITYKLPGKIWFSGLHIFGISDIRERSDGRQQDSERPDNKELRNDQQGEDQQNNEQQNTSERGKSWIPLMIAFAFEAAKCYLIFYRGAKRHQNLSGLHRFFIHITYVWLIIVSAAFTLIFFLTLISQQRLDEASKEKMAEIEANYEELKEQKSTNKTEQLEFFDEEIKRLEGTLQELLTDKAKGTRYNADIQQIRQDLKNEKDERDKYITSVDQLQIEANKAERLASFDEEIKRLEGTLQELLTDKAKGTRYNADIQQIREDLKNEKDKRDEYISSTETTLLGDLRDKQGDISNVKKEPRKVQQQIRSG